MNQSRIPIYIDNETLEIIRKLADISNRSISEVIKGHFLQYRINIQNYPITSTVSKLIGLLNTNLDYKELRDKIIEEKIKKYEMC